MGDGKGFLDMDLVDALELVRILAEAIGGAIRNRQPRVSVDVSQYYLDRSAEDALAERRARRQPPGRQ